MNSYAHMRAMILMGHDNHERGFPESYEGAMEVLDFLDDCIKANIPAEHIQLVVKILARIKVQEPKPRSKLKKIWTKHFTR